MTSTLISYLFPNTQYLLYWGMMLPYTSNTKI